MKNFVVIGNPIKHSKSPEIHSAFAKQFGIELSYQRLLAELDQFEVTANHFFERGVGANVTVPFKENALGFAQELTEQARLSGAVNTLSLQDGVIVGDNTDGVGLVRDIRDNHGCSFRSKKVLIIGAGGASRGVILPISHENPQSITITNRTYEKALELSQQFRPYVEIFACPLGALNQQFDIIINATSASLSGVSLPINPVVFAKNTFVYDMMYDVNPTLFLQEAKQRGAKIADGLGMLVEQAAKSFEIWHLVKPKTEQVIRDIRVQLSL